MRLRAGYVWLPFKTASRASAAARLLPGTAWVYRSAVGVRFYGLESTISLGWPPGMLRPQNPCPYLTPSENQIVRSRDDRLIPTPVSQFLP